MGKGFDFGKLNAAQREAVETLDGPLLILAGAGTGKTRTVTCRMANLIESGVAPKSILAVTFTNKAAREMQERVGGMVRKETADEMTVCTFHSLCVRLLRMGIERLGYKKNFSICTPSDQKALVKQFIVRRGGVKEKVKEGEVLAAISRAKNSAAGIRGIEDDLFEAIAVDYQNELKARNAVDFDDLLLLGEQLLREFPEEQARAQERFRYVTVDEFQDTNSLQMDLLQKLVGTPYNICVVGDDDQSIYGWRGAEVANILQFEKFFPNPRVIRLEENYRSTEAVLRVANKLIKKNVGRREKELRPTIAGGERLRLVKFCGEDEEAAWVGDEIKRMRREVPQREVQDGAVSRMLGGNLASEEGAGRRKWEDFAVLFRTNQQIRKVEEALREREIPYRLIGAQSFYDRREVRDALAYLQVLAEPTADVPLLRILNTPPRGIGQGAAVLATDWSREHGMSLWEAMEDERFLGELSTRGAKAFAELRGFIEGARARLLDGADAREVLEEVLEDCGYDEWLMRQCKTDNEKDNRRQGLSDVKESLSRALEKKKTVEKFLEETLLDGQKDDELEGKQGVTLITLHAAKGLEFPLVFLVGLEEGILPHKRSVEEGTKDEERRLLYVGITRAQEELAMTYCGERVKWGETVRSEPSSFINELDFEWIEEVDFEAVMQEEADEEDLSGFFGGMRAMLE